MFFLHAVGTFRLIAFLEISSSCMDVHPKTPVLSKQGPYMMMRVVLQPTDL